MKLVQASVIGNLPDLPILSRVYFETVSSKQSSRGHKNPHLVAV